MTISIFTLFTLAFCVVVVITLGAGPSVRRRLRHPRLVQGAAVTAAALLVPPNLYCALHNHGVEAGGHEALALGVVLASLTALCGLVILVMRLRLARIPSPLPRRVLVIGAHPDDLELGCGGTIAKLIDSGHEVHALVMTHGGRGGDRSARPQEALKGGRFLGVTDMEVLDFTDTRLAEHETDMVEAIERLVRRCNPDIIFTHSANDQHQDHGAVHLATLRAAREHPAILCYESPSATRAFQPSVFVDIEGYVEVKAAGVGLHRDQRDKPYMTPERVRGLAVYRGGQARTSHAEGYEAIRLLGQPIGRI
jgi:LmbE family N-acetylglucosaminyl deacetylase